MDEPSNGSARAPEAATEDHEKNEPCSSGYFAEDGVSEVGTEPSPSAPVDPHVAASAVAMVWGDATREDLDRLVELRHGPLYDEQRSRLVARMRRHLDRIVKSARLAHYGDEEVTAEPEPHGARRG